MSVRPCITLFMLTHQPKLSFPPPSLPLPFPPPPPLFLSISGRIFVRSKLICLLGREVWLTELSCQWGIRVNSKNGNYFIATMQVLIQGTRNNKQKFVYVQQPDTMKAVTPSSTCCFFTVCHLLSKCKKTCTRIAPWPALLCHCVAPISSS